MNFTFSGRHFNVGNDIREKVEKKIRRLERLFPENTHVQVVLSSVKQEQRAEITVPLKHRVLRAEVSATDIMAAVDMAVDALDKQMVKYKKRIKDRSRRDISYKEEANVYMADALPAEPEDQIKIVKSKRFALKPMDAEEAVMEMELLGHSFFMFRNSETDEINVVYKRGSDAYGLIEPEY